MLKKTEKDLYDHFVEHGIMVEMYASDWVICLFSSIIPIEQYPDFLDAFMDHGWPYFYGVCMQLLKFLKAKLLEQDEISGILYHIKFKSPEKRRQASQSDRQAAVVSPFVLNEESGQFEKSS